MSSNDDDEQECRNCGNSIYRTSGVWLHTHSATAACVPTTVAEPLSPPAREPTPD